MNLKVLFNIPNTIGYTRVVLLYASLHFSNVPFLVLYTLSSSLDMLDGKMARRYNQSTFLGCCLDMVTDRVSTVVLLMKIVSVSAQHLHLLSLLVLTDLFAHLLYFMSSLRSLKHHKSPNNLLLRVYYHRCVLVALCVATEAYYIALYASSFAARVGCVVAFLRCFALVKAFFHVVHLYVALSELSQQNNVKSSGE